MFRVELYVNEETDGSGDYTRLDLFDDENISIIDTIQDARDPASIFTTFSQTFSVPASKTNNKVFKHYYNNRLVIGASGFDARFKFPAIIKINGADYKLGSIKLNSIKLKKNKAYAYSINFIGDGADIRDTVLEDDLSLLRGGDGGTGLDKFNHDYTLAEVKDGMEEGLGLNGSDVMDKYDNGTTVSTRSIIYPFISHTKRYVYNSNFTAGGTFKVYNSAETAGSEGLEYTQLKPAIKCTHIIEAIEEKYGITFTSDFFGDTAFTDLYMWLNRTRGFIEGVDDSRSVFKDFIYTSGVDNMNDAVPEGKGFYTYAYTKGKKESWILTFTTTITGTGNYDFYVYDVLKGTDVVYQSINTSATSFGVLYETIGTRQGWIPYVVIVAPGTITQVDVSVSAERTYYELNENHPPTVTTGVYDPPAAIAPTDFVDIPTLIPKMKVMDFLKGIFRMFNLTHYKKKNGDIYVDTLDNFYALGSDIDITEMVNVDDSEVEVPIPYDYISFKHTEPKYFLAKNRYELLNDIFGDEEYSLGNLFGGSKYEIESGFSHMMFEELRDLKDDTDSDILFGWSVDEDEESLADAPLLMYHMGDAAGILGNPIDFSDESEITTYQMMGNVDALTPTGNTLHWGAEINEYGLLVCNDSLYANYWENYISEVYGSGARLVRYSAYLTPKFILNYNLYDKIVVNGIKHKINSISIDLIDGRADLELITEA